MLFIPEPAGLIRTSPSTRVASRGRFPNGPADCRQRSRAYPLASRPLGLGRNTLRTPHFVNVDLRIVKYFPYGERRRLDFTAEAFNLLNHPKVVSVNAFYGAGLTALPGFGTATGFAAPRQIRFSIDFEF